MWKRRRDTLSKQSQYDASGSLAGYLYQCRLALLLGLKELKKRPNCYISIEKFDDIAFSDEDHANSIYQAKHHSTPKNLTDASVDIWKTIRIWIEDFRKSSIASKDTKRFLITTATAPKNGAMAHLRADSLENDRKQALIKLSEIAKKSTNQDSKLGREAFLDLTQEETELLLSSIVVMDGAPNLHDVFDEIVGELRLVSANSPEKLAQSLEGWWLNSISKRLIGETRKEIPVQHIAIKAQELAADYSPKGLPLSNPMELGDKTYQPEDEKRTYVKQMRLIELSDPAIQRGISDFYRSSTQRSRWARENLLLDGELTRYEQKLQDKWARRFDQECCDASDADDSGKRSMGRKVYFWANQEQVELRNIVETWITAGTFHGLADRAMIGWHPHYSEHFTDGSEDE